MSGPAANADGFAERVWSRGDKDYAGEWLVARQVDHRQQMQWQFCLHDGGWFH